VEAFGQGDAAASAVRADEVLGLVEAAAAQAGPRVRVGVAPHAPYTTGPPLWAALAALPGLAGRPWSTHLAESPDEVPAVAAGDGPLAEAMGSMGRRPARWPGPPGATGVARLAAAGALRRGLVAAHCVVLGPDDPATLAAAGVGVAHCPVSNARLGCGAAPLRALREAGVAVGLGTDSPASALAYDVRAEARAAQLVHGAAGDPPSAEALMRMATLGGARVLGMEGEIGALAPGARADMVALRPSAPFAGGDPYEALLHPHARVVHVWVDGEALLRDGVPARVDPVAVAADAAEARAALC
jgi:5-methylthioadenosine/S-adenosylhomocysteine deaminase